jgi:hypothetical protein
MFTPKVLKEIEELRLKDFIKIKSKIKNDNQEILDNNKLLYDKFNKIHTYDGLSQFILKIEQVREELGIQEDIDYEYEYAFNPKFVNQAVKHLNNETFLYKVLKDNLYKNELFNRLNEQYINDFEYDYQELKSIEKEFIKTNNKAKLEKNIKQLDKLYYSQYNPFDKFITWKEYTLYSMTFILLSLSALLLIKLSFNKLIKSSKDKQNLNITESDNQEKTFKLNINGNYIKRFFYSFVIAFLFCNLSQISHLNYYKQKFFKYHFYFDAPNEFSSSNYFISDCDYYLKDDNQNIARNLYSNTYFGTYLDIPDDLYLVSRNWKGIYIPDFFEYKISIVKLIFDNTMKDYLYWLLIGTLIFLAYYIYNKYLKYVKINFS